MGKPEKEATDMGSRAGGGGFMEPPSTNAAMDPGPLAVKEPDKPQHLVSSTQALYIDSKVLTCLRRMQPVPKALIMTATMSGGWWSSPPAGEG